MILMGAHDGPHEMMHFQYSKLQPNGICESRDHDCNYDSQQTAQPISLIDATALLSFMKAAASSINATVYMNSLGNAIFL